MFSEDDSRENQTTVTVTALNGLVPCVNSSSVRRLSTLIISYEINTIISYIGEQDLTAEEDQLTNDIVGALPLEKVQAALSTSEIKAVTGEAIMGKISVENITAPGENSVETAVRILCYYSEMLYHD